MSTTTRPAPPKRCLATPDGRHVTFGAPVCVQCGSLTQVPAQPAPVPAQAPVSPDAFRQGEQAAYRRVLAFLDALPEEEARSSRDRGRGAAHGAREIAEAVRGLALDSGLEV